MAGGEILERGLRSRVRWIEGGGEEEKRGKKGGAIVRGRESRKEKEINRKEKKRTVKNRREIELMGPYSL